MSKENIKPILTSAVVKKECIIYLGKNNIKSISYANLHTYLIKTKNLYLGDYETIYIEKLGLIFQEISFFDNKVYTSITVPISRYDPDPIIRQARIDKRTETITQQKSDYLNTEFYITDLVFDEYKKIEQEAQQEERIQKSEKDSSNSLRISWWSFWIAIVALILSSAQFGVDYYDIFIGKDHIYEKTTMHLDSVQVKLDSMQIEQNKKIIKLLEHIK